MKTAQAFRAHVLDMFEPQDHPNDFAYPGGPPIRPYDSAGYTLAFQMAVKFDRVLDGFDGPFEEINDLVVPPPPARVVDAEDAVGFFLSPQLNDSFRAVNRLQKAGEEVHRLQAPASVEGVAYPAGTFFVRRRPTTLALLEKIAAEIGTPFRGSPAAPGPEAVALKPARIGLWDRYGGSMPSGWTRWLLEQFEFPFQLVYAPELDKGGLRDKFDVLILVDGAYRRAAGPGGGRSRRRRPARRSRAAAANEPAWQRPVPQPARKPDRGGHRAATEEVPRGRRHGPRHRQLDEARPGPGTARGEPPGRGRRERPASGRCPRRSSTCRPRSCGCGSTRPTHSPGAWARRWMSCSRPARRSG